MDKEKQPLTKSPTHSKSASVVSFQKNKFLITIALSLSCYFTSFAQVDFSNPPWETGCDKSFT